MQAWLQETQQQLSRQLKTNKLPHGLLFSGVSGAGYEELSLWLVKVLLCQNSELDSVGVSQACGQCKTCQLFASSSYPDHITLKSSKATIGVDEVRSLSHFFEKTAHIGIAKTALVRQADTMTISAANALLKTLEEPTSNSFIILTTDRPETLLPTIISRCQQIKIRPPVGESLLAAFDNDGSNNTTFEDSEGKKDLFANLSHYNELSDSDTARAFELFRENVKQYLCYHQQRADLLKTLTDEKSAMRWFEKIMVDLMRNHWNWDVSMSNSPIVTLSTEQLWQVYGLIQNVNMKLKTLVQVNRQFLSEKLLVDITNIVNKAEE
jgi:DNA polymerase-3 subunit delta'